MAKSKDKAKGKPGPGIIEYILSYFRPKDPRTPVKGIGARLKNLFIMHFRGIIGLLVPICALTWQGEKGVHSKTVQCMWMWMFWFFLIQPVNVPVTAIIPLFLLPMAGVVSTADTCSCYMNENILLFILSGMLILLLNNSGVDRRIALWFMCSGDACQFSAKRLILKCSTAAFFLSMLSNRLIVSSSIIQYVTPILTDLQSSTSRSRGTEPDYIEFRNILNNAIQTASSIGSIAIMHSAYATLCFRAIWCESAPEGKEYPDIFNYLQYSAFAFPVAFLMFVLNFCYHMLLVNRIVRKPMSNGSMNEIRKALLKHKSSIPPKVTLHEKLSVFFLVLALLLFFFRWSKFLNMGWGDFRAETSSPQIPGVKDATVAAIFVVAMHVIPKGFGFLKFITAHKKSQLPPIKPESSILWWRFVDKNMNYGYIFLIGSGVALEVAVKKTGLRDILAANFGKRFTDYPWNTSLFLVCLVSVILANAMSGVAACVIFMPLVLNMGASADTTPPAVYLRAQGWPQREYLGALAVGIGSSLGFMCPFLYTPAYFCHFVGKVPRRRMAKYSAGSAIICLIVLWLSIAFWAPALWDPANAGIVPVDSPSGGDNATTTTPPPPPS